MYSNYIEKICKLDELGILMIALVSYIGICVISFALRYMKGDAKYVSFFSQMIVLILLVAIMVSSDNIWLLLISSCFSNMILVSLMIHKSTWKAAKYSGILAARNYLLSTILMGSAFTLFYLSTGQTSITSILNFDNNSIVSLIATILLIVAAMAQSAIWPFHKWLISSLNSPTPVSAIMHAGLINGGGFLLARFAALYWQNELMMNVIFIFGIISALLGTLWKLIQSDVKRMLACSTMGQMGFMFVQCGLGLFPLAIAHLFFHGMFKAYLFLGSGSAGQERRLDLSYPPSKSSFICALVSGACGSLIYAYITKKSWLEGDSTLFLIVITFLAGSQLSLSLLRRPNGKKLFLACLLTMIAALLYAVSTQFIVWVLEPMDLMHPQSLSTLHLSGILVLTLAWISIFFIRNPSRMIEKYSSSLGKFYVKSINASQPCSTTITSHRSHYKY